MEEKTLNPFNKDLIFENKTEVFIKVMIFVTGIYVGKKNGQSY